MIHLRVVGVALLAAALGSPAGAAPVSAEMQVRQLEKAVNAAYAANDLPTYFAFYADDLRALFAEGPTTLPAYKADWTAFIKSGGAIERFQDSDMQIQVSPSGDAAVASYLASVSTRVPGKGAVQSSFSETDVWFRRAGQWKIVEIHYSENPPA
ncbi:MAG: nuclear transport factor 2 family protein, partial [Caulobacteraceae bacterium]|nr:nuclear transport factor 2 family protein [Caulobacteraceae bacterium]